MSFVSIPSVQAVQLPVQAPVIHVLEQSSTVVALQAENEGLRKSVQQLSLQCTVIQADIAILVPLNTSLKIENERLASKNLSLCNQVDALLKQKANLENALKDLQQHYHAARLQIASLQKFQEIVQRDRIAEGISYDTEATRLNLLKDKLLRDLEERAQENAMLRQQVAKLHMECSERDVRITELEETDRKLEHKRDILMQQVAVAEQSLTELRGHAENLQKDNDYLREQLRLLAEIDLLRKKCVDLENVKSQLEQLVEQLRKEILNLQRENRSLGQEVNVQRANNLELRQKYEKIDQHIAALETALDEQSSNNCVLMLKHDVVVVENDTLRQHNDALLARVERLESLEKELDNLRADNASLSQTAAALQQDLDACLAAAGGAQRELDGMVTERQAVMRELADWQDKYAECKELIVKAREADSELTDMRLELLRMREEHARAILRETQLRNQLRTSSHFAAGP